ncbi:MAG: DUF3313 domain-containing protein [Acetobacteraceae bacterium]|nr:DUF3313 domain-containing protein [Acetobacteraceae bacterium]
MRPFCAFFVAALALAACSTKPEAPPSVTGQMPLTPAQNTDGLFPNDAGSNTLVYRSPTLDTARYHGFVVLPTIVYEGTDTDWGNATPEDRATVAKDLTAAFSKTLRQHRRVVAQPGPGIVVLQLTLAGMSSTHPVGSLVRLTPVGLGMTLVNSAAGLPAAFTGSITIAGKLTDGATGAVLGGFVSKVSPPAFDIRSSAGTMTTADLAVTKAADDFGRAIEKIVAQSGAKLSAKKPS